MSPVYEDQDGECVQFWYHMYGNNVGKLSVLAYDTVTGIDSAPLWAQKGRWKISSTHHCTVKVDIFSYTYICKETLKCNYEDKAKSTRYEKAKSTRYENSVQENFHFNSIVNLC